MLILGATFPILEVSIKDLMMARMQTVDMQKAEEEIKIRVTQSIQHPQPIFTKARCTQYRTWIHDPTCVLDRDIVDVKGVVLMQKGATHNPLKDRQLSTQLVFIEGTDPEQVAWALMQPKSKIILVSGSPISLEEQHQTPIYFDQGGHLCKKFNIQSFPTRIFQEQLHLRCESIIIQN